MPKERTHILIAEEMLAHLKRCGSLHLASVIQRSLPSFYLGAIIPDAFFYDTISLLRLSRSNLWISRSLHRKNTGSNDEKAMELFAFISTSAPAWREKLAFAAGIVTHTVSDRLFHGVIDHVIKDSGQNGRPALAIHRQIETLIDMVLLARRNTHPRRFDPAQVTRVHDPTRHILFRFYLSSLNDPSGPVDGALVRALKRAHGQQVFLLKGFASPLLYRGISLSNKIIAGRLGSWSSLFYPDSVSPKAFPILNNLDLEYLTDGRDFSGSLVSLVGAVVTDATACACAGAERLGLG